MGRGIATDAEGILTREHFVTIAAECRDHKKMSCSLGMGSLSDITFISPWGPEEEDLGCWWQEFFLKLLGKVKEIEAPALARRSIPSKRTGQVHTIRKK